MRKIILITLLLLPALLNGQKLITHSYSVETGLPFYEIGAIGQDANNVLWVSDGKKIYYYDGGRFINFPLSKSRRPKYITSIKWMRDSLYFFESGNAFVRKNDSVQRWHLADYCTKSIDVTWVNKQWWWLEGDGLYTLQGNKKVKEIDLPGEPVKDCMQELMAVNDSILVTFMPEKNFYIFNTRQKKCVALNLALRDITVSQTGEIVALATGRGMYKLSIGKDGTSISQKLVVPLNITADKILSLKVDKKGNRWFLQKGEAIVVVDTAGRIKKYNEVHGFENMYFNILFADNESNVWVYNRSSLYKLPDVSYKFYDMHSGLSTGTFNSFHYDKISRCLWLGGSTAINYISDSSSGSAVKLNFPKGKELLFLHPYKKGITGSINNELLYFERKGDDAPALLQPQRLAMLPKVITGVPVSKNNNALFIPTNTGIFSFNDGIVRLESDTIPVKCLAAYNNDYLIAGHLHGGLSLYKIVSVNGQYHLQWLDSINHISQTNSVFEKTRSLMIDKNIIYAGTRTNGIFLLTVKNEKFYFLKQSTASNDFNNPIIWYINKSPDNEILAFTTTGVFKITDTPERLHIQKYDGFATNSTVEMAEWGDDGKYFLFAANGILKGEKRPPVSPAHYKVFFSTISANEKFIAFPPAGELIHLPYLNNSVVINYSANYLIDEKAVQFLYRVNEGQWSQPSVNRSLSLLSLSPGKYNIEVKAILPNGFTTPASSIKIIIRPPFYATWWFISLCSLTVICLAVYLYRQKINHIRNEENLRNKIASDLHDEIGSTLTSINILSNVSQQAMEQQPQQAKEMLEQISQQSKTIQQNMSDIVWSIRPDNEKIENLVVRMREYAAQTLEPLNINTSIEADESLIDKILPMHYRKDILLIYKEAINNISKHANATAATILLTGGKKSITLTVTDNGKWKGNNSGTGTKTMQERAKAMGGQLVTTHLAEGTEIVLTIPVP
jgi:hypothetical protein